MNNLYKKFYRKDRYVGGIEFKDVKQAIKLPARFLFHSHLSILVGVRADDEVFETVYMRCALIIDKNDCLKT